MNPRPSSRIKSLENRATDIEAQITEMSSDTAESLNALQQDLTLNVQVIREDINKLNDGMMASFKELGGYFELTEKAMATKDDLATMATKQDISTLETRLGKIEDTQEQILKLLQQRSGE